MINTTLSHDENHGPIMQNVKWHKFQIVLKSPPQSFIDRPVYFTCHLDGLILVWTGRHLSRQGLLAWLSYIALRRDPSSRHLDA